MCTMVAARLKVMIFFLFVVPLRDVEGTAVLVRFNSNLCLQTLKDYLSQEQFQAMIAWRTSSRNPRLPAGRALWFRASCKPDFPPGLLGTGHPMALLFPVKQDAVAYLKVGQPSTRDVCCVGVVWLTSIIVVAGAGRSNR